MKKLYLTLIALLFSFLFVGCSAAELSSIYTEGDVITLAKDVVEQVNDKDYEGINQNTRSDLKEALSVEVFETSVEPVLSDAGDFIDYKNVTVLGNVDKDTEESYATAVLTCDYKNSTVTYTITFNAKDEIVGFYIK